MIYTDFLLELDKVKKREIYAKIIALTFDEAPTEIIEGRVTTGSVNVDGDSAVRRTCSLTVVANNFNYSDYLWGLNTKFKLEIGIKNEIDKNYPDIIWFPQGVFVITTFNVSRSLTNFTINLTGKDKMCLLNGELGGSFESSIDFGSIEEEDYNGNWITRKIPIADIIRNAVHVYGKEPYHNIIINDLDTYGIELLEYRYENVPLYLYRSGAENAPLVYENALLENSVVELYTAANDSSKITSLKDLPISHLETLTTTLTNTGSPVNVTYTKVNKKFIPWYFTKIEYGQTAGYRETDLVYAGDLIAKVGENLTSILDKIKNMLSNFEYFYNLDGQFVFQKKQSFISTMWAPTDDENEIELLNNEFVHYIFNNSELITAFNNNPNIANVKNDYSVWGERTGTSGAKIPVHIRYAISQKPTQYKSILVSQDEVAPYNSKYKLNIKPQTTQYTYKAADQYKDLGLTIECDWREVIYQMAKDYYRYNWLDDFELRVSQANPQYPTGRTGYERYYTDLEGFWRELYYPLLQSDYSEVNTKYNTLDIYARRLSIELYGTPIDWSENNLGGIENDLNGLSNLLANDYDKAEALIKWWNGTGNKPDGVTSGYYLTIYESKSKFNQDSRDKYIYKEDTNTYQKVTSFTSADTDYYTKSFTAPKYSLIENGTAVTDPTLYFSLLQDLYFRKQSEYNTKLTEKQELENQRDKLRNDVELNYYMEEGPRQYWNKNVYETPYLLNFWFDFLDTSSYLSESSIQNIGIRSKAIQDSNVKSIYFRETPDVIFKDLSAEDAFEDYIKSEVTESNYEKNLYYIIDNESYQYTLSTEDFNNNQTYYQKITKPLSGFKAIQVPSIEGMFTISAQGKSAKERLNELLYQHSCCMETATLTTIPIYYLQPNTRIKIYDEQSHLAGDYIINKISIPLTYNGTMSLTLTKAIEDIIV